MCPRVSIFFKKTFTLWLKKLLGLGRNEVNPYLGSELFVKKKKNVLIVSIWQNSVTV